MFTMEALKLVFKYLTNKKYRESIANTAKLDISEPVYKMVEVVKSDPIRFKASPSVCRLEFRTTIIETEIIDKKTKEKFIYRGFKHVFNDFDYNGIIKHKIQFTDDENKYLIEQLKPLFEIRYDRAERIKKLRNDRLQREARERLFNLLNEE